MKVFKSFDAAWNWCNKHFRQKHGTVLLADKPSGTVDKMLWIGHALIVTKDSPQRHFVARRALLHKERKSSGINATGVQGMKNLFAFVLADGKEITLIEHTIGFAHASNPAGACTQLMVCIDGDGPDSLFWVRRKHGDALAEEIRLKAFENGVEL